MRPKRKITLVAAASALGALSIAMAPNAAAEVRSECGPSESGGECTAQASEGPVAAGSEAGSGRSESAGTYYSGPAPGLVEAFGGGEAATGPSNRAGGSNVVFVGAAGFAHQLAGAEAGSREASTNAGAAQGNLANSNSATGASSVRPGEAEAGAGAGSSQPVGSAGAGSQTDSRAGCSVNRTQAGGWLLIETGVELTTTTDRCGTGVQYRGPGQ